MTFLANPIPGEWMNMELWKQIMHLAHLYSYMHRNRHIQTKPVSKMDFLEISKNLVFSATRCCKSDVCDLRSLIEDACGDDDHEDQDGHDSDQDDDPNDGHYDQDLRSTTLIWWGGGCFIAQKHWTQTCASQKRRKNEQIPPCSSKTVLNLVVILESSFEDPDTCLRTVLRTPSPGSGQFWTRGSLHWVVCLGHINLKSSLRIWIGILQMEAEFPELLWCWKLPTEDQIPSQQLMFEKCQAGIRRIKSVFTLLAHVITFWIPPTFDLQTFAIEF